MEDKIVFYDDNDKLECPICGMETNSLKRYKLSGYGNYLFLISFYEHDVTACPACMRKCIAQVMKQYILKANILYPLVLLDALIHYCMLLTKGHSKKIFKN